MPKKGQGRKQASHSALSRKTKTAAGKRSSGERPAATRKAAKTPQQRESGKASREYGASFQYNHE